MQAQGAVLSGQQEGQESALAVGTVLGGGSAGLSGGVQGFLVAVQ